MAAAAGHIRRGRRAMNVVVAVLALVGPRIDRGGDRRPPVKCRIDQLADLDARDRAEVLQEEPRVPSVYGDARRPPVDAQASGA